MKVKLALTLDSLRAACRLPLPGQPAQLTMAVRPRPGHPPGATQALPLEAAVLILLYQRDGDWKLPLTRRTETVHSHKGQISLPGGAREVQDATLADTAIRETCEELGIPGQHIELLGTLTPLHIPVSGFCVHPHIGYTRQVPRFCPRSEEVAEVLEASLQQLLDPGTRKVLMRVRDGTRYRVPLYQLPKHQVWGATAMILGEFVALLREALGDNGDYSVVR
jgi:8-oxo-dGTP pyrophosphatase MutT (NUDIX family)